MTSVDDLLDILKLDRERQRVLLAWIQEFKRSALASPVGEREKLLQAPHNASLDAEAKAAMSNGALAVRPGLITEADREWAAALASPAGEDDAGSLAATVRDAADWLEQHCPHPFAPRLRMAARLLGEQSNVAS